MKLYCLTLFLSPEHLALLVADCRNAGFICKEDDVTDQTGETAHCWQINASGLHMVAGPANWFHQDLDYEIGITASSREEWEQFGAALEKSGIAAERIHDEEGCDIIIPKLEHCPFFFIMDQDQFSEENQLIRFESTVSHEVLAAYDSFLKTAIGTSLTDKLILTEDTAFRIKSLEIKGVGNLFKIRS